MPVLPCQVVRVQLCVRCAVSSIGILSGRTMASSSASSSTKQGLDLDGALQKAADAVRNAKAIIVTAGAGMGVDSGLPDFRGAQGFWKAYPLLKEKGIQLSTMSTPEWFASDPEFAWWFFAHRYNMYSNIEPHQGFSILREWANKMECGYFVFTSNVDGHFQKAGFDAERVVECHGSINFMQTYHEQISNEIWPVPEGTKYEVDMDAMKLVSPLPTGPPGSPDQHPARPNIKMFNDWFWISHRTAAQQKRFTDFQMSLMKDGGVPFVVIEIGAGLDVPTVRNHSESLVGRNKGVHIRINPNEPQVPKWPTTSVSLPMKGLEALQRIQEILNSS